MDDMDKLYRALGMAVVLANPPREGSNVNTVATNWARMIKIFAELTEAEVLELHEFIQARKLLEG